MTASKCFGKFTSCMTFPAHKLAHCMPFLDYLYKLLHLLTSGNFYRQDCRVAANCRYCFYSQAKNQVFRTAGATRCTDSGQTLQDRLAPGSAWLYKISRQSVQRAENAAPKYQKFSLFGRVARRGDSLDRFPIF